MSEGIRATLKIMFLPWVRDEYFSAGERWFVWGLVMLIILSNGLGIYFAATR